MKNIIKEFILSELKTFNLSKVDKLSDQYILNEVGDLKNINPYSYNLTSMGGEFKFEYNEGEYKVNVKIEKIADDYKPLFKLPPASNIESDNYYNIEYKVEGDDIQFVKTNYSILIKIMKTVSEIINKIIPKLGDKPILFVMASNTKHNEDDDIRKLKLYTSVIINNLPPNWIRRTGVVDKYGYNFIFFYQPQ